MATFIHLPSSKICTGYTFRRKFAALLEDSRADITFIKRHAERKSSPIVKNYLEDSTEQRNLIACRFLEKIKSSNYINLKITKEYVLVFVFQGHLDYCLNSFYFSK